MKNIEVSIQPDGVAHLVLDVQDQKVNSLSTTVLRELKEFATELSQNSEVKALIIKSGKPGIFVAGADLFELQSLNGYDEAQELALLGKSVFEEIENLPFPTIAYIDGTCLGGGLELALACDYRVATDSSATKIGLPEVNLGIFPAWGGTQRLPRLIGLAKACPLILSGKPVDGRKALKLGIVDKLTADVFGEETLQNFAENLKKKRPSRKLGFMNWLLEKTPPGRALFFSQAKKTVMKKTEGRYPAPLHILNILENTTPMQLSDGLTYETETLGKYSDPDFEIFKNLMQIFLTSQALGKDAKPSQKIERTAVVGAGTMGGAIAWLLSKKEYPVRLKDISWDELAKGLGTASTIFSQLIKIRKCDPQKKNIGLHRISPTTDFSGFENADLVIEAVSENLSLKKKVFQDLEEVLPETAILCSNTSSLSINALASDLKNPERFLGMHFFNPANRMPLVEVIPCEKTSAEVVETTVHLLKQMGKTPLVVKDAPGFLVNRLLIPTMHEALLLVEEGNDIEELDNAFKAFGMPMGPMILADTIGLDICEHATQTLEEAFGERLRVPAILSLMVQKGYLGVKSKKGFYSYNGKKRRLNGKIGSLVKKVGREKQPVPPTAMVDRMILIMVQEAMRCLDEQIVGSAAELDLGLVMGAGFPPFRGGILAYVDAIGSENIMQKLESYAEQYGERFSPEASLKTLVSEGRHFYEQRTG